MFIIAVLQSSCINQLLGSDLFPISNYPQISSLLPWWLRSWLRSHFFRPLAWAVMVMLTRFFYDTPEVVAPPSENGTNSLHRIAFFGGWAVRQILGGVYTSMSVLTFTQASMLILTLSSDVLREKQMCSWSSPPDIQNPSTNGIAQTVQSEIFKKTTSMGQWDVDVFYNVKRIGHFVYQQSGNWNFRLTNELPLQLPPNPSQHKPSRSRLCCKWVHLLNTVSVAETCHRKKVRNWSVDY